MSNDFTTPAESPPHRAGSTQSPGSAGTFRTYSGETVEQPARTRKLRDNEITKASDLAWTLPQRAWLPMQPYAIGLRARLFYGVVRPNAGTQQPGDAEATNATRATPPGSLK